MELHYDEMGASLAGVTIPAAEELKRLGITFNYGVSVDGPAKFYGCKNVPAELPIYIRRMESGATYILGGAPPVAPGEDAFDNLGAAYARALMRAGKGAK